MSDPPAPRLEMVPRDVLVLTAPYNQPVSFDALLERAGGGGGGVTPGGPAMGVTDGSEAGPGEIGEVLSKTDFLMITAVQLFSGPKITVGSMTLPPGDWQLWVEISISMITLPAFDFRGSVYIAAGNAYGQWQPRPNTLSVGNGNYSWSAVLGPGRSNSGAPVALDLTWQASIPKPVEWNDSTSTATGSLIATLFARRVR